MTETRGTAREWRLYIVAAVAGVYVLAWNRISRPPQPVVAPVAPAPAVWLDELPRDARPAVSPPAGWRLADRRETAAPTPRRVRAPAPARIRTRSS